MQGRLFDELSETYLDDISKLVWRQRETKILDLKVMIDSDQDSKNTKLFDVPASTILSVTRGKEN